MEDSGTEDNWVSPVIVERFNLQVRSAPDNRTYRDFCGNPFSPKSKVAITLSSKETKTKQFEFLVAPDGFPLEGILLGRNHIRQEGHPNELYWDRPGADDPALLMLQSKITVCIFKKPL